MNQSSSADIHGADTPIPTQTTGIGADAITSAALGVGARVTLAVMRDDYAQIIGRALAQADPGGLKVHTGGVSTCVTGPEVGILGYLVRLLAVAAGTGAHVGATVLLSRGCPGEVTCALPAGVDLPRVELPAPAPTGLRASAEWALYPLDDRGSRGRPADHMRDIETAIDLARAAGTYAGSNHYVTRLDGDLAAVLHTIAAGWTLVGRRVAHVTCHATVSLNSPTAH